MVLRWYTRVEICRNVKSGKTSGSPYCIGTRFEDLCGQKLDWTPLGPITYTCKAGHTRLYWKHEGLSFHADLPADLAEAYIVKHCTPVSPDFSLEVSRAQARR